MGMLVWTGTSLLDTVCDDAGDMIAAGSPIMVLATFSTGTGVNSKTGAMAQTFIMRSDMSPAEAIASGDNAAVCGSCVHRENDSCYTHPILKRGYGGAATYEAHRRGNSKPFNIRPFMGRALRLGAYGDPAAVPFEVWQPLIRASRAGITGPTNHTGYTHQWRTCDPRYRAILMASCDSYEDMLAARAAGWDTYTVHEVGTVRPAGTKPCPASKESGAVLQCEQCLRCGGTDTGRRGNHVAIMSHGSGAAKFRSRVGQSLPLSVAV